MSHPLATQTECPHCGGAIEFLPQNAEQLTACPYCQKEFYLPPVLEAGAIPPETIDQLRNHHHLEYSPDGFTVKKEAAWKRALKITAAILLALALIIGLWIAGHEFTPEALLGSGVLTLASILIAVAGITLFVFIYFLPYIVAANRKHRNTLGILILNAALGWTFLGWLAAMIWAVHQDAQTLRRHR